MTTTAASRAAAPAVRSMMLHGLLPCLPLLAVVPLLAWAAAGAWAALSALLGALLGVVVFALGVVGIRGVFTGPTALTMMGAFGVFLLQMAALGAVIWALAQTTWLQVTALAIGFIVLGLVFQAGLVIGYLRSRTDLQVQPWAEGR